MNEGSVQDDDKLPLAARRHIDRRCLAFEDAWKVGPPPAIEQFLQGVPEAERAALLRELLLIDVAYRRRRGEEPKAAEYEGRFPAYGKVIAAAFPQGSPERGNELTVVKIRCPNPVCKTRYQIPPDRLGESAQCKKCGLTFTLQMSADETASLPASGQKPASSHATLPKKGLPRAEPLDTQDPQTVGALAAGGQAGRGQPLPKIGHYQVKRLLGAGAMGHVYLAHDPHLDRDVAVKVLPGEFAADPERVSRFLREARLAAKIQQPNTVVIHQVSVQDGLAWLVMELLDGGSLDELVQRRGPLPWREATRAIRDAAAGLAAAHEIGLVHRDVKPANLMRTCKGTVKIVDFGLVRAMKGASQLTQTGVILGTPAYMAPEQWLGEEADARSDLYSLACTYYYLLTGKRPFGADSLPALGYQHRYEPFPDARQSVGDLPPAVCRVLDRGTRKEPAERFQAAAELIAALDALLAMSAEELTFDEILGGSARAAAPPKLPPRKKAPRRAQLGLWGKCQAALPPRLRSRGWLTALAAGFAAIVLVLGIVLYVATDNGTVKIDLSEAAANVEVRVDGDEINILGLDQPLKLRAGPHDVTVTGGDFETVSKSFTLRRGEQQVLKISLEPKIPTDRVPQATDPFETANTAAQPEARVLSAVLRHVQPTVVGVKPDRRVGFPHPVQPIFDNGSPEFQIKDKASASGPLNITRLFYCREDTVPGGNGSPVYQRRKVNLWVPVQGGPFAQATASGVADAGSAVRLRPTRPLEDGVYCLHSGILGDSEPPPGFCVPFIVRGYGIPKIEATRVEVQGSIAKLTLLVRNVGRGTFDDGLLVVTVQKKAGNRSEFKDRKNLGVEPIPAGAQKSVETTWQTAAWEAGTYYFYGHINYVHLWDANVLAPYESEPFVVGDANAPPGQDPEQTKVMAKIRKLGGRAAFDAHLPGKPIIAVIFENCPNVTDATLEDLKGLSHLWSLYVSGTVVTGSGLRHLNGLAKLTFLALDNTKVTDAGLAGIKGLTRLQELVLANNNLTGAGLEQLEPLTELETLSLFRCQGLTDADLRHLKFPKLRSLTLSYVNVADAGLENLKGLTNLQRLFLNETRITDAGLRHLAALPKLSDLCLSDTEITDAGLEHLERLAKLQSVSLEQTKVTDDGVRKLHQALPKCRIYRGPSAAGGQTADSGSRPAAPRTKQADAVAQIKNLGGNVTIDQNDPRSPVIWVSLDLQKITDAALKNLDALPDLQTLSLFGCKRITDAGLVHLKNLAELRWLNLGATNVTGAGLENLEGLTNLGGLVLDGANVTDAGLKHLERLTNLQILGLNNTKVTDAGLKHLKGLAKLESLGLRQTQVTDEGVKELQQALPNCKIGH